MIEADQDEWRLPVPGQRVRMEWADTEVDVGERLDAGGQAVIYRVTMPNGSPFVVKWYRQKSATEQQRHQIVTLMKSSSPHPAFVWPMDVVTNSDLPDFGYLMPLMEPRFISFGAMLKRADGPLLRSIAGLARDLVDAFEALHGRAGWCYRDINFNNVFADPEARQVCILDNDNIGTDDGYTGVLGTPRWMAPEVVRGEALPSAATDLYSLAVLLYVLFVRGHPLSGRRVESLHTWDGQRHQSEEELAKLHYGEDPLFVFDPDDESNRPMDGDTMWGWWSMYPAFLRDLFIRSFTAGLHDPSLRVRVLERNWRDAVLRLRDSVDACAKCDAVIVYDRTAAAPRCWNCHLTPATPHVLYVDRLVPKDLRTTGLVLSAGAELTNHHLRNNNDHKGLAGLVDVHPREPGRFTLSNLTDRVWNVQPVGEDQRVVEPGKRLAVRPMTIDFGTTAGHIALG